MKTIIFFVVLYLGITKANTLQDVDETDPKESFFRYLRFPNHHEEPKPLEADHFYNIPQPGILQIFNDSTPNTHKRHKRQDNVLYSFQVSKKNDKKLHSEDQDVLKTDLIINDFIRFKRDTSVENDTKNENFRKKREPEIRTKKMILEHDMREGRMRDDRDREERGVTKEQWIKQPYPVEQPAEDNIPSASGSDSLRAPRVHFVTTQRRPELPANSPPSPALGFREREGRSRDPEREHQDRDRDLYLYPYPQPYPASSFSSPVYPDSRARDYEPYRPRYYDPYYRPYEDRDRRFDYDAYDIGRGRPMLPPPPPSPPPPPPPAQLFVPGLPEPSKQKQRRIIYYATLPEVVRNPTSIDNEEQRYRYRSNYDDRYDRPDYRSQLQLQKQRHNEQEHKTNGNHNTAEQAKTPLYPVKVSTDVNVREPTKNPERRIYSDVNRRFNYKSPKPNESNF